jgi:N-acyl homoserine lactone hydrolase
VTYVGISHSHTDHTGQLADFPGATLLIGARDWAQLIAPGAPLGMSAAQAAAWRAPFAHWLKEGGRRVTPEGDQDVFGDGSVIMLATPGHTPGHHSLLVRLARGGAVLLSGDLAHFRESYATGQVPIWNTSRADTLASLERFRQIAANLKARVILQHDPRDIDKLPPFPQAQE